MRGGILLVLLGLCGSFAACSSATTSSAAAVSPTPNKAAEVAAVKAAVTAFISAYDRSGQTGNAAPAEALTVPGSTAQGNAGDFASAEINNSKGFAVVRLDIDASSWSVSLQSPNVATATVSWRTYGHWVTYPQLEQIGPDQYDPGYRTEYELQKVGHTWLISSFT